MSLCEYLEGKEIPILAANLYYDGTDGNHEAGENVLTPYVIRTVKVNGHDHRIGVLALWSGEIPGSLGLLAAHPDNTEATLSGEAARYLPKMREEGCESIIVCCFGQTDTTDMETDEEEQERLTPAEQLIRENAGIDLLILPEAEDNDTAAEELTGKNGRKVPVLRENEELSECVLLLTEGTDGRLSVSLKKTEK